MNDKQELPLSIVAVFGWTSVFGVPIHQMSVNGLTIALSISRLNAMVRGCLFPAPVEMRIYGPDLAELRRLGIEMREMMTTIPDVIQVRDDLMEGRPKLGLTVDNEQVQQAGLNNTAIAQQLEIYSEGVTGGAILESTENLPVRVRLTNRDRASLQALASLDLRPDQRQDRTFRSASALDKFDLVQELASIAP